MFTISYLSPAFPWIRLQLIQALLCRVHSIPTLHDTVNDSLRLRHFLPSWFSVRDLPLRRNNKVMFNCETIIRCYDCFLDDLSDRDYPDFHVHDLSPQAACRPDERWQCCQSSCLSASALKHTEPVLEFSWLKIRMNSDHSTSASLSLQHKTEREIRKTGVETPDTVCNAQQLKLECRV